MSDIKTFGVIGGDKRNILLSDILKKDGHYVKIFGFDNISHIYTNNTYDYFINKISKIKYVILPIVPTKDYKTIFMPFSSMNVGLDNKLIDLLKNKIVFCGKKELLYKSNKKFESLTIKDYSSSEDFMILNALPTAEAAISIALQEHEKILFGSNCLITGFGRIGKILSKLLKAFGSNVEVSARKNSDISWIEVLGYTPINNKNLKDISKYDLIFNTVPNMILNKHLLSKCKKDVIIIDLASKPGGTDFEFAEKNNIKVIHALGLPGKCTPYSAANIIKKSIYKIIKEENL